MKTKLPLKLVYGALAAVTLLAFIFNGLMQTVRAEDSNSHKVLLAKKDKMNTTDPVITIETNKGVIKARIFKSEAPITSANFLDLVNKGFYNGKTFHRYEPGFVIQGGDPKGDGTGNYVDPATKQERHIPLEVKQNLKHDAAGVLAMARTNDPNSASCQFYITLAPTSFLDMQYAVFGKVTEGLNVVEQLRKGDKMTKVTVQQ